MNPLTIFHETWYELEAHIKAVSFKVRKSVRVLRKLFNSCLKHKQSFLNVK